jgi:hypothetical protein
LWSECVFPNSYVEILIPKMMIWANKVF